MKHKNPAPLDYECMPVYRFGIYPDGALKSPDCSIVYNNLGNDEPCSFCGNVFSVQVGPAMFRAGTLEPVCIDCGHAIAPILASMLDLYWSIRHEVLSESASPGDLTF